MLVYVIDYPLIFMNIDIIFLASIPLILNFLELIFDHCLVIFVYSHLNFGILLLFPLCSTARNKLTTDYRTSHSNED